MEKNVQNLIEQPSELQEPNNHNGEMRKAYKWVEGVCSKVESDELRIDGIEIFSDEALDESDLKFISETKIKLDIVVRKNIRIIILNKDNWQKFMEMSGRSDDEIKFTGRSEECPLVPDGLNPFIVLPSSDVAKTDTEYKEMYKLSPRIDEYAHQIDGVEKLYKGIYLRCMMSHEMSHVYQVSQGESGIQEFEENLPSREFLAIAFGMHNLKKFSEEQFDIVIEASQNLIKNGNKNAYAIEQAKRILQATELLKLLQVSESEKIFNKCQQILSKDNIVEQQELRNILLHSSAEELKDKLLALAI